MDTAKLLQIKVKDVMTTKVMTVRENDVMSKVENLMIQHNFNHIPIVDDRDNLVGILTKNDIQLLKDWGTNLKLRTSLKANEQLLNSHTADDRMNRKLVMVGPDDTLKMCADIFSKNLFHALPVTEGTKLVGIITTYDLLNVAYARTPLHTLNK
ncbi:MAG: CBS domain-containing membrane protein [Saprospiraceae bacterium]|jgi:CBS domain-containing membrane protein